MGARFAAILADPRFADPLPIWSFCVEHTDGVLVIDAGATPAYNDRSSWANNQGARRFIQSFIRIAVAEDETLPAQLELVGIHPTSVDAVVLTHQHIDHTASVPSFPNADLWTTKLEDQAADSIGACQWRWRTGSNTARHIDVEGNVEPSDPDSFGGGVDLVADGSVRAFHTPGHTPGSVTVRLATDQCEVWFTGDTSFTADTMNPNAKTAGIHTDMQAVRALHAELQDRRVLLPSHDWDNAERLTAAGSLSVTNGE